MSSSSAVRLEKLFKREIPARIVGGRNAQQRWITGSRES
jgi:hypothetical protein